MPNESSTLPVLPRFGDPDSWAANVATKQDVADAKLAATTGSTTQTSITISGTGGAGFISLPAQASTPAAPSSGFAIFADSTGRFSWRRASDGFVRTWDATLTANRVYTLPDATTTIAGLAVAQTFSAANVFSANGALSAPAVSFTGTPITGGTASTTQGLVKIGSGTSGGLSTSGQMLEIQAPAGFGGYVLTSGVNGTPSVSLDGVGNIYGRFSDSKLMFGTASDTILSRKAAANWQLGGADAAAPVAQAISVQSVAAGTTDTAGANWTFNGSRGTGTGAGGTIDIFTAPAGSTGSSQNALVRTLRITSTGTFSLGANGNPPIFYTFSGASFTSSTTSGPGLGFFSNQSSATGEYSWAFSGAARTATSGTIKDALFSRTFSPTSGTGTWTHIEVAPTINQTGGANGITRGIYVNPTLTAAADFRALEISDGNVVLPKTVTAGGTTGAQTINKVTGSVNFAAAATTLVVTNSYVTTSSIIIATVATNDTTMKSVAVVAGSGSFTIYANTAATAETRVNFLVTN